jgi:hypothetical protein
MVAAGESEDEGEGETESESESWTSLSAAATKASLDRPTQSSKSTTISS